MPVRLKTSDMRIKRMVVWVDASDMGDTLSVWWMVSLWRGFHCFLSPRVFMKMPAYTGQQR